MVKFGRLNCFLKSAFLGPLLLALQCAAFAAEPSPIGYYSKVPTNILDAAFALGNKPNEQGFGDHNSREHQWLEVGQQRGPIQSLVIAAVRGDASIVERDWPAVDVAFTHQRSDGSFEQAPVVDGYKTGPNTEPTSGAFFVSTLAHGLLLIEASSLQKEFQPRIDNVKRRLQPTMRWLATDAAIQALMRSDNKATNRVFADAKALLLGGLLVKDRHAMKVGESLLRNGLSHQRPDGVFPENGGADSGYQSASLFTLETIADFVDRDEIMPALQRGVVWELSRIQPDGTVEVNGNSRTGLGQETYFGVPKGVNTPEIVRALALYAAMTGDPKSEAAAEAVDRKYAK